MRHSCGRSIVLASVVVLCSAAQAQDTAPEIKRKAGQRLPFVITAAVRTAQPPAIDGRLDDSAWADSAVADRFVLYGGTTYATQQTEARVLWDDSNLYIGMACFDAEPQRIKAVVTQRDGGVCAEDCVEIFLVPGDSAILAKAPAKERYFHLCANARGTRYDEVGYQAPQRWNGDWRARTTVHDDRWEIELAIAWSDLRVNPPRDGTVWDVNFNRGLPARGALREYSGWSITYAGFHDPEHFGKLLFLERWPEPGNRSIDASVGVRILRGSVLDPVLDRAAELLRNAEPRLRALTAKTRIERVRGTLVKVQALAKEVNSRVRALEEMPPPRALERWEALEAGYRELLRAAETLSAKAGFCAGLTAAQLSGDAPIPDVISFVLPAITNERVLPRSLPAHVVPDKVMRLTACPGEYESGSFGLYALKDARDVRLAVGDLASPDERIPAAAVDLRLVKVWYQGGTNVGFQRLELLTPELLLKDDDLVRIDERRKVNVLKYEKDAMRDAATLQPFALSEGTVKQCWLTVHVPAGTAAGTYVGRVRVEARSSAPVEVPVELRVLPFRLSEPRLICSIYYRSRLGTGPVKCNSEQKTEGQLLAEFRDMRAHGVTNPTVYQGTGPQQQRYFELRAEAGLRGGPLLTLGVGTGAPVEAVSDMVAFAKRSGFSDAYFYAADERSGEELRAERALFKRVHAAGGKVFVACYRDSYEIVGDLLDFPIYSGRPDVEIGRAFHANGHLIGSYGNPQGGVEEPETYRRNYGLALWRAGYDCACTYAYQHSFGHAWDDFDHATYRDHNMAYPTVDGVIPTIQWEGYREGYDDLRYLATLQDAIEAAKGRDGPAGALARAAELWVLRMDPDETPLDELRRGMIERILTLRQALDLGP